MSWEDVSKKVEAVVALIQAFALSTAYSWPVALCGLAALPLLCLSHFLSKKAENLLFYNRARSENTNAK